MICRQRPSNASGVTFITLEDETGFLNVVVWRQIFDDNVRVIRTTSFLGVSGMLQSEAGVVHLVAERFWVPKNMLQPALVGSRDFH